MALTPGQKAPDFTLASTTGKTFSLNTDLNRKPCILYFYPMDFSTGCTNEACGFRDTFDLFEGLNITILGISRDDIPTHHRFKEALKLPFDLLSDPDGKISKLYDTTPPFMDFFTKRTTYLLDADHVIQAAYENVFSARKHIKEMAAKASGSTVTK